MAITVAQLQVKVGGDTAEAENKLRGLNSQVNESGGFFKNALSSALGFAAGAGAIAVVGSAVSGLTDFIGGSIQAGMDQEKVMTQTAQVIKSTGGAAGVTAEQVGNLADSLARTTPFSDDVTQSAENMLLTFTDIGSNVFPQATKTVLDMSQALGQDTKSSAIQLGKALEDPIKGITALSRVGVAFSQDQKDAIKTMMSTNDIAGAQGIILKELSKEFGGSAEAAGTTFAGKMAILNNTMDQTKEKIGLALIPVLEKLMGGIQSNVLPIFDKLAAWFIKDGIPVISKLGSSIEGVLVPALGKIFTWIGNNVIPILEKLANFVETKVMPSVGQLVGMIVSQAVPIFHLLYIIFMTEILPAIEKIGMMLENVLIPIFTKLSSHVGPVLIPVLKFLGNVLATEVIPIIEKLAELILIKVLPVLTKMFNTVMSQVMPVLMQLAQVIMNDVVPVIEHIVKKVLSELLPALLKLWNHLIAVLIPIFHEMVSVIVGNILPALEKIANKVMGELLPALLKLWNHIQPILIPVLQLLGWVLTQVVFPAIGIVIGIVGNIIGIFIDLISHIVDLITWFFDLANGIKNALGSALGAIGNFVGTVLGFFGSIPDKLRDAGVKWIMGLINGITSMAGAIKDAVTSTVSSALHNIPIIGGLIPGFAMGTSSAPGGMAIVGENGPELVMLPQGSQVIPNNQTRNLTNSTNIPAMQPSNNGQQMTSQTITIMLDGRQIARTVLPHMASEIRLATGIRS